MILLKMSVTIIYMVTLLLGFLPECIRCSVVCSQLPQLDRDASCLDSSDDQAFGLSLLQMSSQQHRSSMASDTSGNAKDAIRDVHSAEVGARLQSLQDPASSTINTTCQQAPIIAGNVNNTITQSFVTLGTALAAFNSSMAAIPADAVGEAPPIVSWTNAMVNAQIEDALNMMYSLPKYLNKMRTELIAGLSPQMNKRHGSFMTGCNVMISQYNNANSLVGNLTAASLLDVEADPVTGWENAAKRVGDLFDKAVLCRSSCCKAQHAILQANQSTADFVSETQHFNTTYVAEAITGALSVINDGAKALGISHSHYLADTAPATIVNAASAAYATVTAAIDGAVTDVSGTWTTVDTIMGTLNDGVTTIITDLNGMWTDTLTPCPQPTTAAPS